MNLKIVIFDLDGVIFNSEPLHKNAKRRILAEEGISEYVDLSWSVGQPNKILWQNMIARYGLSKPAEELERLQYNYILEEADIKQIYASDGLHHTLQWLQGNKIKIALASSSNRCYVDDVLKRYKISDYFDYTVAGDEVKQKKPEPDIYLKVLDISNTDQQDAIAVEDSSAGSIAAASAGIQCIGYLNPTSGLQDLSSCFFTIDNLNELTNVISKL